LWGETTIKRRAWKEGVEAYRYAFRASETLFSSQRDRSNKETRLREVQGLGARSAYVLARDGKLKDAVVALERARTVLVADALSQGTSSAGHPFTYARIASAAAATPIVHVELVSDVGFALIVKGKEEPRCVWLPELNESALRDKLNPLYVDGYNNRREDPERWQNLLDETARWLWPSVMAPILEAIKGQPEVVLIPGDLLPFAPLHAAWTTDNADPTGRKYAADRVVLRYVPSARAWLSIADRTRIPLEAVLCVQEPGPATVEPLPNAHFEVGAVAAKFPAARVLAGADAEVSRVAAELANVSLAHFACHAFANKREPLEGGLIMSGDAVLSLSNVFSMNLTHLRLAVLSACETGVMGQILPDEAVSLPTGLMQAGVPGVVASLWSVPDISTALLMAKFYDLWPGRDMSPAKALNKAQKWIRETTNGEMAKQLRGRSPLFKEVILREPESRDFSAVADWGTFYITGG
jgi:CHAT domain-containing protein